MKIELYIILSITILFFIYLLSNTIWYYITFHTKNINIIREGMMDDSIDPNIVLINFPSNNPHIETNLSEKDISMIDRIDSMVNSIFKDEEGVRVLYQYYKLLHLGSLSSGDKDLLDTHILPGFEKIAKTMIVRKKYNKILEQEEKYSKSSKGKALFQTFHETCEPLFNSIDISLRVSGIPELSKKLAHLNSEDTTNLLKNLESNIVNMRNTLKALEYVPRFR